jgi:hypothetical protein
MSNFQHAGDWGAIHSVVKDTLDRGHNRYRYHLNKKRKRERRDK